MRVIGYLIQFLFFCRGLVEAVNTSISSLSPADIPFFNFCIIKMSQLERTEQVLFFKLNYFLSFPKVLRDLPSKSVRTAVTPLTLHLANMMQQISY